MWLVYSPGSGEEERGIGVVCDAEGAGNVVAESV